MKLYSIFYKGHDINPPKPAVHLRNTQP